jgi:acetyl-CoA acetyltransferase family protein
MVMTAVYLVDGVRTPFGKFRGSLSGVRPDDLAAFVVGTVAQRSGLDPQVFDEVVLGCANQAGEDNRNIARMAVLLSGLPVEIPGFTVNRLCASGLTSVASAFHQIKSGEADVVIAGGVESMSRAPWVTARPERAFSAPTEVVDSALGWRFVNSSMKEVDSGNATVSLGETAERVADLDGITRADSDAFAIRSHQSAVEAQSAGFFSADIVEVPTRSGSVISDEGPRGDSSAELMAELKPAFRSDGIVTAGSSSPLSDGAAALILASEEAVDKYDLSPLALIKGTASAGVPPSLMGLGPVPATQKLLDRLGMKVSDIDVVEINEAFAPQVLACVRRLGIDPHKVNAWGGAIALGHPLGASGTRILLTLARRLRHEGGNFGLATLCVGVGQGTALVIERA